MDLDTDPIDRLWKDISQDCRDGVKDEGPGATGAVHVWWDSWGRGYGVLIHVSWKDMPDKEIQAHLDGLVRSSVGWHVNTECCRTVVSCVCVIPEAV